MRVLGPDEAAALLPGLEPPALPAVMGLVIGVADLGATRDALPGAVRVEVPEGIMVPASEAAGCALLFAA